jgi:hypothetical protein
MKSRKNKPKRIKKGSRLNALFGFSDKKNLLIFISITCFTIFYALLMASSQVNPTGWSYTETYEEGWMNPSHDTSGWSQIQLPFLELEQGKVSTAYYRGEIEISGLTKPDVNIQGRRYIKEVYLNGQLLTGLKANPQITISAYGEGLVIPTSLFRPGKNLLAVSINGDAKYRILGIYTQEKTVRDSVFLLLFYLAPALLFIILSRKNLESATSALFVFTVASFIFLTPMFKDFNYLGVGDWVHTESYNEIARKTILEYHQIPLWDPYISGGSSFIGDPQSLHLSPLFPLILIFNAIYGMKLQIIAWYIIGMMGMYLLGRHLNMGICARYLMAFAFMLSSIYSVHITQSHPQWHSLPLLPWTFLFYLKSLKDKRYAIPSAISIALMLFDGSVYLPAYTAITLFLYSITISAKSMLLKKHVREVLNPLVALCAIGLLCISISAVKALPMLEQLSKYPRFTDINDPDQSIYRGYNLERLYYALLGTNQKKYQTELGMSVWDNFGAYLGPIVLLLSLLGIILYGKLEWPLIILIIFGIVASYGTNQSGMVVWGALHKLPVFSSLRYPSRILLIAFFPLTIFAGYAASKIENKSRLIAAALTVLVFYNLMIVDNPTLREAFTITPRPASPEEFKQITDNPDKIFVYSEAYYHVLMNHGVVDYYGSPRALSSRKSSALSEDSGGYKGETYLEENSGTAHITSFTPNRLIVSVNTTQKDTLLINQDYDSGWKARDKEVYENNGLIAVDVLPEDREVLLFYSPDSFKIGLLITALSALLIVHTLLQIQNNRKLTLRKYVKSLNNSKLIIAALIIILVAFFLVDFIQYNVF